MNKEKLLSNRMKAIFDCVRPGATVADVGTDHAHIPISLILEERAERVIAVDVKEGPIQIATANIKEFGCEDRIEVRFSDGLENVNPEEVDTVIIAGMGGTLICDILNRAIGFESHDFILQPMTAQEELREYLYRNGYTIIREQLVKEDEKLYTVMVVVREWDENVEEIYYHVGKKLFLDEDPLLPELLRRKYEQWTQMEQGLKRAEDEQDKLERVRKLKEKISELMKNANMQ